jgi:signal transduction histidine kinase
MKATMQSRSKFNSHASLNGPLMNETTRSEQAYMSRVHKDERVIIIAPVGQDAEVMAALLDAKGFETQICNGLDEYSRQITDSAGALLLTEEALESVGSLLLDILKTQPPWSELPLIILTSGGESRRAGLLNLAAAAAGTVTLLERPISTLTLIRSVQVALHSRRRQYQVRDLVTQLANLNQTLEQRVAERTAEAVEKAQKLRLLSAELSLAEEAERRRIAEMLHEDLQQLLVTARMQLAALCRTRDATEQQRIARQIADVIERSFNLTRSLSTELAPPVLHELGLAAALEWLAAETRKNYNVEVTVEADSSANPKAADVRTFLFRAVRELLLNSVKHTLGGAVHITMQHLRPDKVCIVVADNGPGFDPGSLDAKLTRSQKFGLLNIRERVSTFGGKFHIDSGRKRGTRITLSLPRGSAIQVRRDQGKMSRYDRWESTTKSNQGRLENQERIHPSGRGRQATERPTHFASALEKGTRTPLLPGSMG